MMANRITGPGMLLVNLHVHARYPTCSSSFEEVFLSFEEGISSSLKWWVDCPIKLFQRIISTGSGCEVVSL
jgi:hypothetical protein